MPTPLHMTKIAFGCADIGELKRWFESKKATGHAMLTTRYKPKRADEMIGGSLYWIVNHMLVARSEILRFDETATGRIAIILSADLIPVEGRPKRAHQGWRYLEAKDAPADLASWDATGEAMPPGMQKELARLGLL